MQSIFQRLIHLTSVKSKRRRYAKTLDAKHLRDTTVGEVGRYSYDPRVRLGPARTSLWRQTDVLMQAKESGIGASLALDLAWSDAFRLALLVLLKAGHNEVSHLV